MDPNFNLEEFAVPDKDYGVLLQTIYNKPIPENISLLSGQEFMVNFIEPARRGIFFVDAVEDPSLRQASASGPNLRICMWPSKRVVLKESEIPKVTRELMVEDATWDDATGWTMTGASDSLPIDQLVLARLRKKYQCVATDKVMSVLRGGGYLEQPNVVAKGKRAVGPRESDYDDVSDPDYSGDEEFGKKKKKKPGRKPKTPKSESQPGKKFRSEGTGKTSAKFSRMSRELSSKGGPMSDKIFDYLMAALDTGDVKEGMPEEHIKDYEKCWVRLNDKSLPFRCFDGIGTGEGWWGIWHRATNRLVVRLSETKTLVYAIMALLKTKSPAKIFEYQRTRYCLTRDRIRDFIDGWGVYKSSGEEDSDDDGAGFVALPGRPANRFVASATPVEIEHDDIGLQDSGDERERELDAEKAKTSKPRGKKKKGRPSVQPNKADDRAKFPMHAVQIDCVSTQSANYASKSYGYILVVRCVFSGYIFARAIPDMERGLLCRHLMDIFGNFGPPKGFFTSDTSDVVRNCAHDVEGLFRIQMKPLGKSPPNTHPKLLKMFRDRCYEKAMESFGDQRRWVEILPYTVMEFNQRLKEGDVLSPFEIMFAREPWEGIDPAPWVQTAEGSKAPAGFVNSAANYFARAEHAPEELRLYTRVQTDIRRRAAGMRPSDCRTVRVGTEAPYPPPCDACKGLKSELAKSKKSVKLLEKEAARAAKAPAPSSSSNKKAGGLSGGYWEEEPKPSGKRAAAQKARAATTKRPRKMAGGTDTDDSADDEPILRIPRGRGRPPTKHRRVDSDYAPPSDESSAAPKKRKKTTHPENGLAWVPLSLNVSSAEAMASHALTVAVTRDVLTDVLENVELAVEENGDADYPFFLGASGGTDFDAVHGSRARCLAPEDKSILYHPISDAWFLPCAVGPIERMDEAEWEEGLARLRERRAKAAGVRGTRRPKREGWAEEVELALLGPEPVAVEETNGTVGGEELAAPEKPTGALTPKASISSLLLGRTGPSDGDASERMKLNSSADSVELEARLEAAIGAPVEDELDLSLDKDDSEKTPPAGLSALQGYGPSDDDDNEDDDFQKRKKAVDDEESVFST